MKILIKNKKAFHDYEILDKYEAGISLDGWEVKSIRIGNANLKESFISVRNDEAYIHGMHVSKWITQSKNEIVRNTRERKLLLNKSELKRISQKIKNKGLTVVPLMLYISNNQKIKLEIAVARGKREYEKKDKILTQEAKTLIRQKESIRW